MDRSPPSPSVASSHLVLAYEHYLSIETYPGAPPPPGLPRKPCLYKQVFDKKHIYPDPVGSCPRLSSTPATLTRFSLSLSLSSPPLPHFLSVSVRAMFSATTKIAAAAAVAAIALLPGGASAAPVQMQKRHFAGQATYFAVGLGACGWTSSDADFIVALNTPQYSQDSHCGQQVAILNQQNGVWQTATVVDECPGCADGSLDMSPALFAALNGGNMDQGVFPIGWHFV